MEKVKKEISQTAKISGTWYRSILVFTCVVYFVSAFLLYSGTLLFSKRFSPARIYGMVDGEHPHLQRTAGVFFLFMTIINSLPIIYPDQFIIVTLSVILNVILFIHISIETFVFWALRLEFMILIFVVMGLNMFWAAKEYFWVENKKNL